MHYHWEPTLRARCPLPDTAGIQPYYFSLDGGGRELVVQSIRSQPVQLMVEIGSFLCGSTIQWLAASDDIQVIGVDPWDANFAAILERYKDNKVFDPCFAKIPDREEFIASVRQHGPYTSAMANVNRYRERFIPVRARSPQVLSELADLGVSPDMIYFDSNKLLDDLQVAMSLFPGTTLCGDDWTWGADIGFPVQTAVKAFCAEHRLTYRAARATWIIDRPSA